MLVDDEKLISDGIRRMIEKNDCGFEIAAEAENGKQALDIARNIQPDVIISDIRMPHMDGLEMARLLVNELKYTKIIFLSGYDDFSYAQNALKIGVSDYLLKPISRDELYDTLNKLFKIITEGKKKKTEYDKEIVQSKKNLIIVREKFVSEMIGGNIGGKNDDELMSELDMLGINIRGKHYILVQYTLDKSSSLLNQSGDEENLADIFCFKNIVDETVSKWSSGFSVFINHTVVAIVSLMDEQNDIYKRINDINIEVFRRIKDFTSLHVECCISSETEHLWSLKDLYRQIADMTDYKNFYSIRVCIMEYREQYRVINKNLLPAKEKEKELFDSMELFDMMTILRKVNEIFDYIGENRFNTRQVKKYVLDICRFYLRNLMKIGFILPADFEDGFIRDEDFLEAGSIRQLKELLLCMFDKIIDVVDERKKSSESGNIIKIKEYVIKHLSDDITLECLGKEVFMNPNYLSDYFKHKTGENLFDFITSIRIQKAREMFAEYEYKTYEVAGKVGYDNPKYFAKVFKKLIGMTPKEYRESIK